MRRESFWLKEEDRRTGFKYTNCYRPSQAELDGDEDPTGHAKDPVFVPPTLPP